LGEHITVAAITIIVSKTYLYNNYNSVNLHEISIFNRNVDNQHSAYDAFPE